MLWNCSDVLKTNAAEVSFQPSGIQRAVGLTTGPGEAYNLKLSVILYETTSGLPASLLGMGYLPGMEV